MELIKLTLLSVLVLLSRVESCVAIDIGSLTTVIQDNDSFTTKTIINNTHKAQFYSLSSYKLNTPKSIEGQSVIEQGEFLFTPKKFNLNPGERKLIKVFYNGERDDKERYYKIIFNELPAPNPINHSLQSNNATFYMSISVEGIFVVRPRLLKFSYDFDSEHNTITNNGNTYFEVIQKRNCKQLDSESMARYLLKGETISLTPQDREGDIVIIYKNRFISLTENCKM